MWERFGVDSPIDLSVLPAACKYACFSLGLCSGLMDVSEKLVESYCANVLQVLVSVVGLVR